MLVILGPKLSDVSDTRT